MVILSPEDLLELPDDVLATYFSGGYGPGKRKSAVATLRFLAEKHLQATGRPIPKLPADDEPPAA